MFKCRSLLSFVTLGLFVSSVFSQISDNKIKVGVLTDMSSLFSDVSGPGSVEAAKMAIEKLGGKIAGVPIELVFADHQNKADIGASIARRWYEVDGVDVILDVPNSAVALAVNQISKERGKALVISGAASSALTGAQCSRTLVHWSYDTFALANVTGRAIVEDGGKNWYFLTADYAFGHALQADVGKVIEARVPQSLYLHQLAGHDQTHNLRSESTNFSHHPQQWHGQSHSPRQMCHMTNVPACVSIAHQSRQMRQHLILRGPCLSLWKFD